MLERVLHPHRGRGDPPDGRLRRTIDESSEGAPGRQVASSLSWADPGALRSSMHETSIKPYLSALRANRVLIVAVVVVCTAATAAFAWTREPLYAADAQLFVSTQSSTGVGPSEIYQGGLASQSRAQSYASLVSSTPVAEAVIEQLGLSRSAEDVKSGNSPCRPKRR